MANVWDQYRKTFYGSVHEIHCFMRKYFAKYQRIQGSTDDPKAVICSVWNGVIGVYFHSKYTALQVNALEQRVAQLEAELAKTTAKKIDHSALAQTVLADMSDGIQSFGR